ncbi:hypothetical protein [Piscinibacter sp. XHJ-5]|uniref:hypothetical protein n=1 Tax=Piscinibacter sp. XHJ-5 TaxID=3037797 RepID=UPI0024528BF2|nr:hypothetical protein [Piscinibacter sp. XHJ-5]
MRDYSFPLSSIVMANLIGLPPAHRDRLRAWLAAWMRGAGASDGTASLQALTDPLRVLVAEKAATPRRRPAG